VLLALLFMIPSPIPPRGTELPRKEMDLVDRLFTFSILGNDLVRVCQYAQYGFLLSQVSGQHHYHLQLSRYLR
jgi:hypothetical protein